MKNSIRKVLHVIAMLLLLYSVQGQALVELTGKVTDDKASPLYRVSIRLLNTQHFSSSDSRGNFVIKELIPGAYTIELSAIGYATIAKGIVIGEQNNSFSFQLQNSLMQLESVTVTAEKKEGLLQNVPVSITAITSRQVQEYRLWNAKDITAIVPNLYSSNPGDERNVTSIRGITSTSYDPAVTTYIDGVNQFSLDTYIPQLADIERIEILRGPQGTLYGRNAMGGVINIITKQPANHNSGFIELNVGNYNQQRYSAGFRSPLIKNKLFLGASGVYHKRNGFYTNLFNNTSFDRQRLLTGNYYLRYLHDSRWSVTLNAKYQNNRNRGAFPLVNGVEEAFQNPFQLTQNALGKMIDNTWNASLSVSHTGRLVNITSQLALQKNYRYYNAPIDGDFSQLDAVTISNNYGKEWNHVKVITHELRLTSSPQRFSLLKWTGGTYFFHQKNPSKVGINFGRDAGMIGVPDTDFSIINSITGKNTGIAVYGQIDYKLSKKLSMIAGIRYDYEIKKLIVKGEYQKIGNPSFVTRSDTSASSSYSAVSPKLGIQYQIDVNHILFAIYSRGYRTGGLTPLSADPSQPPLFSYLPEYSNNIEIGIKNNFLDNRFRLNVSAFLTYVNNAQVPTLILPDAITVTRNTGKLSSKGIEVEIAAKPTKGLQLDYNFGVADAEYKSLTISQNGQTVNLNGKNQIFTPSTTSLLALQYSYLLKQKQQMKLIARGEWFYLGNQYFDLANNIRQSPYHLFNTQLGVSCQHIEVVFWMRNIFNEKYIAYAYDFGGVHLGDPKTYGATFRYAF